MKIITLFTFFCFFNYAFSQLPSIEWQNTIGSQEEEEISCIIKTSDGGFLVGGFSTSGIGTDKTEALIGGQDCWIVKLNLIGEIEWQRTLGGTLYDKVSSVIETSDGGYFIGAFSYSDISATKTEASLDGDYWVIKMDVSGNIEWQNCIGGSSTDFLSSVEQTMDGGYILGGSSYSGISGDKTEDLIGVCDYWVVKINDLGILEWQTTIGGDLSDALTVIHQTDDEGYIVGGYSNSNTSGDKSEPRIGDEDSHDYWILKLDNIGNIVWQNTIGGYSYDALLDLEISSDGNYIVGGYSNSGIFEDKTEICYGGYDYWLMKLDILGNILWQNTIGGNEDDFLHAITITEEGNIIIAGNSESGISFDKTEINIGERDFWPVQVDSTGNILWQKTLGGVADDYLWAIAQTDDGWPILAGHSVSGISGDKTEPNCGLPDIYDQWILKFDSLGNIEWQNTIMGNYTDFIRAIEQTSDKGYIIVSQSSSKLACDKTENSLGANDYWVIKLDSLGNIEWQNTIGGSDYDEVYSVIQTADGGYLVGGDSESNSSDDKSEDAIDFSVDYWVVKLNAAGVIEWENTLGGDLYDHLKSVKQTFDGGYILGGSSTSDMSDDKSEDRIGGYISDYWVVKLNSSGTIEWDNTIGGTGSDLLSEVALTSDSGFILGGFSESNISFDKTENSYGESDYWIIKLDSLGNIQWQKTIGGELEDYLYSLSQTSDHGYIAGGYSTSGNSGLKSESAIGSQDYWIIKLDSLGNIEWQNTIGGTNADYLTKGLSQTIDFGFILAGYSNSEISGDKTDSCIGDYDYWVLKLDQSGNILWQNTIGGSKSDLFLHGFDLTLDNGFIIGGSSNSGISGDKTETICGDPETFDWWIIKLQCAEQVFYADFDEDGFGDMLFNELACIAPPGFVSDSTDCDDTTPLVYPGATEIFNGIDDNCNDTIDENFIEIFTINNEPYLNISPNPNTGTFNLVYNSPPGAISPLEGGPRGVTFQIFNSLGQSIFTQQLNTPNGNINETISIQNLCSGIYFVRINNVQQKLIIE